MAETVPVELKDAAVDRVMETVEVLDRAKIRLTKLAPEQAAAEWRLLGTWLLPAIARAAGRIHPGDVLRGIQEKSMVPFLIWDPTVPKIYAVLVAQVGEYPHKRVLELCLCAGEGPDKWVHLWPALVQFAREHGMEQIEVSGRRGWKKFMPEGAVEVTTTYIYDLEQPEVEEGAQNGG